MWGGNIGTQVVHFTALPAQTMAFGYNANGNPTHSSNSLGSPVFTQHCDAENRLARALSDNVMVLECWHDGARRRGGGAEHKLSFF